MEAEGRSYSELYRNSSEEIFLKSIMESSIAMPAPTMESLGFKNISQSFRADSEELFNNWLMNGESNGSIAHRTRQSSRRISTELAALCSQQNGGAFQTKLSNSSVCQQNLGVVEDSVSDSQRSVRNVVEKGFQASNLFLAKAWFHSSQPMTRSRSSELRRRYAAMQNFQMSAAAANPTQSTMARGENIEIQSGLICDVTMSDRMTNQITTLMSASTPASSPFTTPPMAGSDAVSSVVSMLKGTLERKKQLNSHTDNDNMEDDCYGSYYGAQEVLMTNMSSTNQAATQMQNYPGQSQMHVNNDFMHPENIEYTVVVEADGFGDPPGNPIQMSTTTASQEPSQSESSAVAPAPSSGFEVCDGPASSGQNFSVCESARRHYGNGSSENGPRAQDSRERIFENNIKDGRKKGSLARLGSVTSAASGEKADPTKKRRVERSRKMAEAKERIMTPAVPSDAQALLKRCENLEKEVRSLKLNLSFMNRKDSEQTKQIEELQKQNKELGEEKERLLEEIERIL